MYPDRTYSVTLWRNTIWYTKTFYGKLTLVIEWIAGLNLPGSVWRDVTVICHETSMQEYNWRRP